MNMEDEVRILREELRKAETERDHYKDLSLDLQEKIDALYQEINNLADDLDDIGLNECSNPCCCCGY